MTTVIVTPTHIAQDHCVVSGSWPSQTTIDVTFKKIFVPRHKRFIIATEGKFRPEVIDTKAGFALIESIVKKAFEDFRLYEQSVAPGGDDETIFQYFRIFDITTRTIVVTQKHRMVIMYSAKSKKIIVGPIEPIYGLGSGGSIAMGLIKGGVPLKDIWSTVSRFDNQTSEEHTIIPLSILRPWRLPS